MNLGPQRMPATLPRLRARWRQVSVENREALEVRREWMALLGCDEDEIEAACQGEYELSLDEELRQLAAARRLSK